jgi:protein TonB
VELSPKKFAFLTSILCHGVAFTVIMGVGITSRPEVQKRKEYPPVLTLISVPDVPPASPVRATVLVPPIIPKLAPVVAKATAPAAPIEPVKIAVVKQPSIPKVAPVVMATGSMPTSAIKDDSTVSPTIDGSSDSGKPDEGCITKMAQPEIIAMPNYFKNPDPSYPALARRRHQEGVVLLAVKVTAKGKAKGITVKKSSGFRLLDEAALKAVQDWEFQPARAGSLAVDSEIEVPVQFKLVP